MTGDRPRGRRPGGGATREVILAAARELFAELGFERTTMRAIAARADCDPALIHHYFDNKDGLLVAALDLPLDPTLVLSDLTKVTPRTGEDIVREFLTRYEQDPLLRQRMLALMRTAMTHEQAARLWRLVMTRTVLRRIGGLALPDRRERRAALVASQLGGLALGRYVLKVPGIADASIDSLVTVVGPVVQHYLQGPIPRDPS